MAKAITMEEFEPPNWGQNAKVLNYNHRIFNDISSLFSVQIEEILTIPLCVTLSKVCKNVSQNMGLVTSKPHDHVFYQHTLFTRW